MNPLLIVFIFLCGCLLWLLCAFLYKPIGKLFNKLLQDSKEAMFNEDEKKKEDN